MRLRYTRPALDDLASILDYIAERSPQGANRVQARIQTIIGLLVKHPYAGALTADPTIRRMPTAPYPFLIFYETTAEEIVIMPCATAPAIRPAFPAARNPDFACGSSRLRAGLRLMQSLLRHGRARPATSPASGGGSRGAASEHSNIP